MAKCKVTVAPHKAVDFMEEILEPVHVALKNGCGSGVVMKVPSQHIFFNDNGDIQHISHPELLVPTGKKATVTFDTVDPE